MSILTLLLPLFLGVAGDEARVAMEACKSHLESIKDGRIEFRTTIRESNPQIFETTTGSAWFNSQQYRLDFQNDRYRFDDPPPKGLAWDAVIWDGSGCLHRDWVGGYMQFQQADLPVGGLRYFNPRFVGLPRHEIPNTDIEKCLRLQGRPITFETTVSGGLLRIIMEVEGERKDGRDYTVEYHLDPSRGHQVTYYKMAIPGKDFYNVTTGEIELSKHGEIWFPKKVHLEKFTNQKLNYSADYEVLDAEFNVGLNDDDFSWEGLGIEEGDYIHPIGTSYPIRVWKDGRPQPVKP